MTSFQLLGSTTKDVDGAYEITLFGSTSEGKSVSLVVTGYQPFFYVSPATLGSYMSGIDGIKTVKESHKTFWDFTNNADIHVLKVTAPSKKLWLAARDLVLDKDTMTPRTLETPKRTIIPTVYEANIDPILRFYHLREIKPAGWIQVGSEDLEESDDPTTTTELQYTADWNSVGPASPEVQLTSAPLRIMSWDIECTSSHGDFPQATKTWRKPVREAIEAGLTAEETIDEIRKAALGQSKVLAKIHLDPRGLKELEAGLASLGEFNVSDIDSLDERLTKRLPTIEGDPVIQIGSVTYVGGKPVRKDIMVLGSCEPVDGVNVTSCKTEKELIESWAAMIKEVDPDLMIGYNIFGFDNKYLWERAKVVRAQPSLKTLGRETDKETWDHRTKKKSVKSPVTLKEKFLSSSAMGDNTFHMFTAEGRMHIDLLAYVRRNAVLDSYSLDNVTATYMAGSVGSISRDGDHLKVLTKSTKGTGVGRAVVLMDDENDVLGDKFEVIGVEAKALLLKGSADAVTDVLEGRPVRWSQAKDNVSPQDIFRLHGLGAADRAIVAKYCIQDCDLVMELFQKLEVLNNSIAMANVCWVPLDYIFTRGQGIKSESLVFYECRKEGQLIPVQSQQSRSETDNNSEEDSEKDQEGYEGAIVLDPLSGIYLDDEPVAALDFSSLYPSSIISENLSQDTVVWVKDYDQKGSIIGTVEGSDTYDNLEGVEYLEVDYDILKPDPKDKKKFPTLIRSGRRVCRYATSRQGTLPKILQKLLSARKATRKLAEKESDDFKKSLLDAQQLAYKLTANSLYGQLGSNTSKIRRKCLAASTTGHGRQQLLFSKACIEEVYGSGKDKRCDAVVVYGDTDSVFISFRPSNPETGERLRGREAQAAAKELAEEAGALISGALKPPHDFEFDKMFRCFCLLSKKRYVGDMTEGGLEDADYHRKSMGIVMKRRDNAPIVKTVYGGVIERILVERDVVAAFTFARQTARDLMAGKFPMKRLTITKSLKAEYKLVPAHKILADRIGERDPGNKPASNDRIPYVYVKNPTGRPYPKDTSQGDRIEIPSYIVEQGLTPDYAFYITNQIAKPVAQVFGLVLEKLPGIKPHQIEAAKKAKDPTAAREALAESLLFGDILVAASGQKDIRSWFTKA